MGIISLGVVFTLSLYSICIISQSSDVILGGITGTCNTCKLQTTTNIKVLSHVEEFK